MIPHTSRLWWSYVATSIDVVPQLRPVIIVMPETYPMMARWPCIQGWDEKHASMMLGTEFTLGLCIYTVALKKVRTGPNHPIKIAFITA